MNKKYHRLRQYLTVVGNTIRHFDMIVEHVSFVPPDNPQKTIWRYMDFTKLADIILTRSIYFSRADLLGDVFEGSIPKMTAITRERQMNYLIEKGIVSSQYTENWWRKRNEETRKEIAVNCWHMNDFESAAMWKLYLKSNEGIAIQSTYSRLHSCLLETDISILMGIVYYRDYDIDYFNYANGLTRFVHKLKSFAHEEEFRCVIWSKGFDNEKKVDLTNGGVKVPIDLHVLIENIYVSPDSPIWLTELVQLFVQKQKLNVPVLNSRLRDSPIF